MAASWVQQSSYDLWFPRYKQPLDDLNKLPRAQALNGLKAQTSYTIAGALGGMARAVVKGWPWAVPQKVLLVVPNMRIYTGERCRLYIWTVYTLGGKPAIGRRKHWRKQAFSEMRGMIVGWQWTVMTIFGVGSNPQNLVGLGLPRKYQKVFRRLVLAPRIRRQRGYSPQMMTYDCSAECKDQTYNQRYTPFYQPAQWKLTVLGNVPMIIGDFSVS